MSQCIACMRLSPRPSCMQGKGHMRRADPSLRSCLIQVGRTSRGSCSWWSHRRSPGADVLVMHRPSVQAFGRCESYGAAVHALRWMMKVFRAQAWMWDIDAAPQSGYSVLGRGAY